MIKRHSDISIKISSMSYEKHEFHHSQYSFANKLSLLKRPRFLPKEVLEDFYFKIILPSVNYGLVLWGSCCNTELIHSIERLHCRAARIIYNLPKDMASTEVPERSAWTNINFHYKFAVLKLVQNAYNDTLPTLL